MVILSAIGIATNPNVEGETTSQLMDERCLKPQVIYRRLSCGVTLGGELGYQKPSNTSTHSPWIFHDANP